MVVVVAPFGSVMEVSRWDELYPKDQDFPSGSVTDVRFPLES